MKMEKKNHILEMATKLQNIQRKMRKKEKKISHDDKADKDERKKTYCIKQIE